MSHKPKEFIKKIRACKTLDEERCLVNKESAEIRNLDKDRAEKYAVRSLSKCIAMSLLGYPTEFIHMTCLGLLAGNNFTQKRLAYLGICVLLDEKSEVLLLTSHTIKKDLGSMNQFIVAAALNAIGEIATADMCRDTCSEVIKCLSSLNPYIKKKAALALVKIIKQCPELVETVAPKLKVIFEDRNHGVLLSGLTLVNTVFKMEPSYIKKNIKYVAFLIKELKILSTTNYSPEYDINGVTDPFLQTKILETLAIFATMYDDQKEDLSNILGSLPTSTDTSTKNTGNAVLYELVRTIFSFESSTALRSMGGSILGKFLCNKDNNYKYIALDSLQEIAKIDINIVQKHKNTILEFLNDSDIAIKRKSLDLTYTIVNEGNIQQIIKESLNFLNSSVNNEFKEELTGKIFESLEKYSPSLKWQIDTLLKMLCLCEDHINDDIINKIINLIVEVNELHQYAMFKFFVSMKSNLEMEGLLRVGIYLLGEFCEFIIGVSAKVDEDETVTIKEEDIVSLIKELINRKQTSEVIHEELMNCCFKILGKLSHDKAQLVKELIENEGRSYYCEVQQRANEYLVFTQIANDEMQKKITTKIPVHKTINDEDIKNKKIIVQEFENPEEKDYCSNLINNTGAPVINKELTTVSSQPANNGFDLLDGITNSNVQQSQQPNQPVNLMDDIGKIFQTNNSSQPVQQPSTNTNVLDLFDLTGGNNQQSSIPQSNPVPSQQAPTIDLLSQLGNMYQSQPMPQQPLQSTQPVIEPMSFSPQTNQMKEVFKNADLCVYSSLTQNNTSYEGAFFISNNTMSQLTNVKLNFLVKKNLTLKVISNSGNVLSPNSSLGIKKEVSIVNNDPSKPVVIKIKIEYNKDGQDVTDSTIINNI